MAIQPKLLFEISKIAKISILRKFDIFAEIALFSFQLPLKGLILNKIDPSKRLRKSFTLQVATDISYGQKTEKFQFFASKLTFFAKIGLFLVQSAQKQTALQQLIFSKKDSKSDYKKVLDSRKSRTKVMVDFPDAHFSKEQVSRRLIEKKISQILVGWKIFS